MKCCEINVFGLYRYAVAMLYYQSHFFVLYFLLCSLLFDQVGKTETSGETRNLPERPLKFYIFFHRLIRSVQMRSKATNKAVQSTASSSSKTGRAMLLDLNLPQLQNFIKRDAKSYRDDFLRQLRHYESSMEILRLQPSQDVKDLADLILFIAHVIIH
jgi:hypothetical protein